jgi:hypothetical protein
MVKDSPYSDWRMLVLSEIEKCANWRIACFLLPSWLRWIFVQLFFLISPSVPVNLRRGFHEPPPGRTFLACYALTVFFCLIVTAGLCGIEGTLWGQDPARRYFLQDGWNLFFYTVVCPVYVSFCVLLICLTISKWSQLADFADAKAGATQQVRGSYRVYSVLSGAFLLCTVFITTYMQDILHPSPAVADRARVYWFMVALADGTRGLNRVGYYYVAMNFCLLFITILGVACFLSLAAEVLRAGGATDAKAIDTFEVLQVKLAAFTEGYIYTKALAAAYAVNFFVWAVSPLGNTGNLVAAQIALTIVGVFFIAVPRQYIELRWYELWHQSGQAFEYIETRSPKAKLVASVLDAFFISLIVGSWGVEEKLRSWFA